MILNASRVIGPAVGALMLATAGFAACFYVNAASFVPAVLVLLWFRPPQRGQRARVAGPPSLSPRSPFR